MIRRLLLIDYENVQNFELTRLADDVDIVVFVGAGQKSIPFELVKGTQPLGARVQWRKCEASGRNALDFEIACHLGGILEKSSKPACFVLSNDKDFDAPSASLTKKGLKCKRITTTDELESKVPAAEDANYERVLKLLRKSEKKARPRKRTTLAQHISSMFQKNISKTEITRIIDRLFADKRISESGGAISYAF